LHQCICWSLFTVTRAWKKGEELPNSRGRGKRGIRLEKGGGSEIGGLLPKFGPATRKRRGLQERNNGPQLAIEERDLTATQGGEKKEVKAIPREGKDSWEGGGLRPKSYGNSGKGVPGKSKSIRSPKRQRFLKEEDARGGKGRRG